MALARDTVWGRRVGQRDTAGLGVQTEEVGRGQSCVQAGDPVSLTRAPDSGVGGI